jgi:hypothetical protein
VVGLGRERAEVEARRRQELTGEEGIDGEVVPVEVWPWGWLGSVNEVRRSCGENWGGLPMANRRAPELREGAAVAFGSRCVRGKGKREE